jgi:AcrR family transcriptional regulator
MIEGHDGHMESGGNARSSSAPYGKLSPGPGRPASEVAAHQRARIHGAMIEIAAEGGYGAVTVRGLARLASVSTRTFYEHFRDKEECFLSTYELVVRSWAQRIFASQAGGRDWQEQVRLAFSALTHEFANEPHAARLALVEASAAGPAALERMRRAGAVLEAMAREGFSRAPDGIAVPPLVMKGMVAGVWRVACARLLAGRERELPALANEMMLWSLSFRSEAASKLELLDHRSPVPRGTWLPRDGEVGRQVFGDERALILAATTRLAANEGYRRLSAPGIRAAAGVSRKSLDAHFADVTDCFLAALDVLIRRTLAYALRHGATADTWPGGLHRAMVAFCTSVARDPAFAKLGFVELFAPGTPGIRFRARLIAAVAERLRQSAPSGQRPSELAAEASVGAALGIIHHQIVTGRASQLPRAAPTLSFLMLAPAIGAPKAVDAIHKEQAQVNRGGEAAEVTAGAF